MRFYLPEKGTSDIFVATSIKGELQIIRVKDGEYNVFVYLVFDQ